jgi:hypothetical protein
LPANPTASAFLQDEEAFNFEATWLKKGPFYDFSERKIKGTKAPNAAFTRQWRLWLI